MAESCKETGWRQGDLLRGEVTGILLQGNVDGGVLFERPPDALLLCSQDCDLVANDKKEPWVELLGATICTEVDGSTLHGRNPRLMQIPWRDGFMNFSIHSKIKVPKNFLALHKRDPESYLHQKSLNVVLRWLSRRYIRAAFPDAFNARLDHRDKHLGRWEKRADAISIILLRLDTYEELDNDQNYSIDIVLGTAADPNSPECQKLEEDFEKAFLADSINVRSIRTLAEDDITYRMLKEYKRWDRDFRSLPQDDEKALPGISIDSV
jgi:hypothetical protein